MSFFNSSLFSEGIIPSNVLSKHLNANVDFGVFPVGKSKLKNLLVYPAILLTALKYAIKGTNFTGVF